jgi:acetyltransferase-like isoleucine patch superfamily enzyme
MTNISCCGNEITIQGADNPLVIHDSSMLRYCTVHVSGEGNAIAAAGETTLSGSSIRVHGNNNLIRIGKNVAYTNVSFFISGDNNEIVIGDDCSACDVQFHIEQNNNTIRVGNGTTMHGRGAQVIHMAVDEGSKILIGEDCMLAHSTQMRSTDSHSIVDLNGNRLNPAKDIRIGVHCWIGMQCIILKGTEIAPHCVMAAGTVCSKKYNESHCVIGGNPAKIIKREIDWDRKFV